MTVNLGSSGSKKKEFMYVCIARLQLTACLALSQVLPYTMSLRRPLTLGLNAIGDKNVLSTKDVTEGLKDVVSVDNVKCVTQTGKNI